MAASSFSVRSSRAFISSYSLRKAWPRSTACCRLSPPAFRA